MISEILNELKRGHRVIEGSLVNIQLEIRSFDMTRNSLKVLLNTLLDHCALQKDTLYEYLLNRDELTHQEKKIVEFLRVDLREMKVKILEMFDGYVDRCDQTHAHLMPKATHEFCRYVSSRLDVEKKYLIPFCEK